MVTASINAVLIKQTNINLPPKKATEIRLLQKCLNFDEIKQIHAQLIVSGLVHRVPNHARLLEAYILASQMDNALSLFSSIQSPDIFAYNSMIRGFILGKRPNNSLMLLDKLLNEGVTPDNHTYTFILKACSHLKALSEGKQIHCRIIKDGIEPNTHVHSSLINMYSISNEMESAEQVLSRLREENVLATNMILTGYMNQGRVETARKIFDTMRKKDNVSWSLMVSGYNKNGFHEEALMIFEVIMASKVLIGEATLVSALSACSNLGNLDQGIHIHRYIQERDVIIGIKLWTALVEMYAKCGRIEQSYEIFVKIPDKDIVTWGVMISGFSQHGQAQKCFELFDQMINAGNSPNKIVFVSILSACAHKGYVEMGYRYFNEMLDRFNIKPCIEHYGCMVDLLGRAGRLDDAEELISAMVVKPNDVIWGALLNACKIHGDLERGKRVYERLSELGKVSIDRYKLAVQMFVKEDANEIRKLIRDENCRIKSGMSLIEVDGVVHKFMVGDITHESSHEIYHLLRGSYVRTT